MKFGTFKILFGLLLKKKNKLKANMLKTKQKIEISYFLLNHKFKVLLVFRRTLGGANSMSKQNRLPKSSLHGEEQRRCHRRRRRVFN